MNSSDIQNTKQKDEKKDRKRTAEAITMKAQYHSGIQECTHVM